MSVKLAETLPVKTAAGSAHKSVGEPNVSFVKTSGQTRANVILRDVKLPTDNVAHASAGEQTKVARQERRSTLCQTHKQHKTCDILKSALPAAAHHYFDAADRCVRCAALRSKKKKKTNKQTNKSVREKRNGPPRIDLRTAHLVLAQRNSRQ